MSERDNDPLSLVGSTIADKYAIESLAGDGGFSVVYRARHQIWDQPVAVKFFNVLGDAKAETRDQLLQDFIQEGRLMSELSSRSTAIVQARDIGKVEIDGSWVPYMVLEWIDGAPLDHIMYDEVRRGMPCRRLAEAMTLLEPVAQALDVAHRRGIAHRDLKPANIMVLGDPRAPGVAVKVLDFGIAKVMAGQEDIQEQLQKTGQNITSFTPHYGAPEQFSRNFGATGPWTDVYAMALILLELLDGERALKGRKVYDLGIESCNIATRPTPRTLGLQVSDEIEAVFARAVAVSPADRHRSMYEMWSELHDCVFGTPWGLSGATDQSRPRPSKSPANNDFTQLPTAPGITAHVRPRATGGYLTPALAAVGLVTLGGGAMYLALGSPTGATNASTNDGLMSGSSSPSELPAIPPDGPCPKSMKPVIGGTFTMGSNAAGFPLWQPAHEVTIDSYCLDVTEVTVAAYARCVERGNCKPADKKPDYPREASTSKELHQERLVAFAEFCNASASDRDDHPINCIDWFRADAYCKSQGLRLPSEAEWEFAARGTDGREFPWGDDPGGYSYMNAAGNEWAAWLKQRKLPAPRGLMYNKDDGYIGTAPVGRFPRAQTQNGHLDMIGNVWEWTDDWFELYKAEPVVNPKGASIGDRKAIRGGGYDGEFPLWVKPAARDHQLATASAPVIGFRCASKLKPRR